MLKKILGKLSNPLLFYVEKSGKSVFKNYNLLKKDGCLYSETYSIQMAGKALEYRMELDKKLNFTVILITLFTYLLLVNMLFSLWSILLCFALWCVLVFVARRICFDLYSKFLQINYGNYLFVEFNPPISHQKNINFIRIFVQKILILAVVIGLLFTPAFLLSGGISMSLKSKKPHYKTTIILAKIYNTIYPKSNRIYEKSAYSKYMLEDYEGALKDYERIFHFSGKHFSQADFRRFSNLLYLERKLRGSLSAIELFDNYSTRKKMNVLDASQLLWIKSMFSLNSEAIEFIIQDYDDLLLSLKKNDNRNKFYISGDKAYMMYLLGDYSGAVEIYNYLISFAVQNQENYGKELPRLYAERGYAKRALGDNLGADDDFVTSEIDMYELPKYKPVPAKQGFISVKL